jgi:biopolymer transport protein TolR
MSSRGRRLNAEINIVPYIDVMLVLLVIFMITAPLLTPGVTVNLPQAAAKPLKNSHKETLVLSVDSKGRFYLNVGAHTDQPVSDKQVMAMTAAVLQRRAKTPVLVRGDQNVPYGRMIHAMTLLQRAGAPKVGLVTKTPPRKGSGAS